MSLPLSESTVHFIDASTPTTTASRSPASSTCRSSATSSPRSTAAVPTATAVPATTVTATAYSPETGLVAYIEDARAIDVLHNAMLVPVSLLVGLTASTPPRPVLAATRPV
ncbi:hypothetical protein [Nannocystis pusilla]|uniref:Uncharacterized protein n=1 Tax=Nannocystis pusilla TaxID=889268 RepID=A0ABS7U0J9_9BACT|nr:hypothetical protein [Nannocystis pusilla]MBZ5713974.1 hypothetical protein [Nannocystis pusilla]